MNKKLAITTLIIISLISLTATGYFLNKFIGSEALMIFIAAYGGLFVIVGIVILFMYIFDVPTENDRPEKY